MLAAIAAAAVVDAPETTGAARAVGDGQGPVRHAPSRPDQVQRDLFESVATPPAAAAAAVAEEARPRPARVHLTRGYRQSSALQLAPLAQAVRAGHADTALSLLQSGALGGITFHAQRLDPLATDTRAVLLDPWRALAGYQDPGLALAQVDRVRVLTALREGGQGAIVLNARIEEALAGAQRERYFAGRLLLVTENSYRHGLFNGDIGVCLRDDDGAMVAWFASGGDGPRAFHPAALPAHDSAFAMTVHKAQGSEYDTVWLQLPRQDARTLSRELVYTALTRARHGLHLAGSEDVLRAALARHAQRVSGLADRLR